MNAKYAAIAMPKNKSKTAGFTLQPIKRSKQVSRNISP